MKLWDGVVDVWGQPMYELGGTVPVLDISCLVQVRYMYQADRSVIGSMPVWHDQTVLQQQLSTQISMLLGRAPPEKVPIWEDWKCAYCIFYHACGGPMKESTAHEISIGKDVQERGRLAA